MDSKPERPPQETWRLCHRLACGYGIASAGQIGCSQCPNGAATVASNGTFKSKRHWLAAIRPSGVGGSGVERSGSRVEVRWFEGRNRRWFEGRTNVCVRSGVEGIASGFGSKVEGFGNRGVGVRNCSKVEVFVGRMVGEMGCSTVERSRDKTRAKKERKTLTTRADSASAQNRARELTRVSFVLFAESYDLSYDAKNRAKTNARKIARINARII